jgi:hypothetical protein
VSIGPRFDDEINRHPKEDEIKIEPIEQDEQEVAPV